MLDLNFKFLRYFYKTYKNALCNNIYTISAFGIYYKYIHCFHFFSKLLGVTIIRVNFFFLEPCVWVAIVSRFINESMIACLSLSISLFLIVRCNFAGYSGLFDRNGTITDHCRDWVRPPQQPTIFIMERKREKEREKK